MLIGIDASRANQEKKTGVGWYAYHLLQELKKITPDNVRVVLYTDKPLRGELAVLPANWSEKVLHWPLQRLWTQIRLSWEMFINPPDILFIPAHVFPIIHPHKTVMTVHDVAALRFSSSYNRFERWYSVWSAKFAVKNLWKVIVPSEFVKKELSSDFRFKDLHKVEVIYHGYDKRYELNDKKIEDIKQILDNYSIYQPYLLSVGRLEEKKNTVNIIKAFEKVRLQLPDIKFSLVLVGEPGYGYEKVKQAIENSQFENDIIIPGWVSEADLPYLFAGAELFVFPSLYEGFGLPVLQAFVSRVPVVASKGGSLPEIGGEAGLYVDPASVEELSTVILQLLKNQELKNKQIEKGLERIKNFSWEKSARETWRLLLQS